ncbi:hypothetical protein K439DRAFT_1372114, partial [Ramaria rubella]
RPILLWSVPRSTSTAFERAFMQRDDAQVLHEVKYYSPTLSPERLSNRYNEAHCAASSASNITYSDIHHLITNAHMESVGKLIIVKDMAQYIVRPDRISVSSRVNPTVLSDADLKKFRHTFLIRTPKKTLPSYYRATMGNCGDFGDFDPNEAGFAELQALLASGFLLTYTRRLLPEDPLVLLDSDDLIANPERALRAFCAGVGISFKRSMLSWERKRVSSFDKWKGFHDQAQNSTGFKEISHEDINLPQRVTDAIDSNLPIYQCLQEFKLRIC